MSTPGVSPGSFSSRVVPAFCVRRPLAEEFIPPGQKSRASCGKLNDPGVSQVDPAHESRRITRASRGALRRGLIDSLHVGERQYEVQGSDVLLQIGDALGAGNRHDVFTLCQYPGEC